MLADLGSTHVIPIDPADMIDEDGRFELVFFDCARLLAKLHDSGEVEYLTW